MRHFWFSALLAACSCGVACAPASAQQINFLEKYALAADRDVPLNDLIPGSQEYFYFHTLRNQTTGRLAEAEAALEQWALLPNRTPAYDQMLNRQRLLTYSSNPQKTIEHLRQQLGFNLDHAPPQADRAKDLSTRLDPSVHVRQRLLDQAIKNDPTLSSITDAGLYEIVGRDLSIEKIRIVLQRLRRVDLKGLLPWIEKDLRSEATRGWGGFEIHALLTLEQRQLLVRSMPQLLENDLFVRQYLLRLLPQDDIAANDIAQKRAHLQRLEDFTASLPPSMNSLKGLILYHRLLLDASEEKFDRGRFERYLALPRQQPYYSQDFLNASQNTPRLELQANYQNELRVPPIGDDLSLIRRTLEHFLQSDNSIDRFAKWLNRGYLESVKIETMILYGIGPSAAWYAKLSPSQQKELRERVELRFAPISQSYYQPSDSVELIMDVKNVPKLIVRVYQLNPQNIYRKQGKQASTDIDLDGLVANAESTLEYSVPGDRRHRERIELPQCTGRGVWIIDLLGGGLRSRAMIIKGQLRSTQLLTDAGHELRIFDESGKPVPTAKVEIGTRTFEPEKNGAILIPYGDADETLPILLVDGGAATVELFHRRREDYTLEIGCLMDAQNLLSGAKGSVIVRPQLLCNRQPISIESLEDPQLTILTTDHDGTQSSLSVPDVKLANVSEFTHQFLVPQRLRRVDVTLTGKIKILSRNVREIVSATQSIQVNDVAATTQLADFYLVQDDQGYRLRVVGRNGEPIARLPLTLQLSTDSVNVPVSIVLATDLQGEVGLGTLTDVYALQASATGFSNRSFSLRRNLAQWPSRMSVQAGTPIQLPWTTTNMLANDQTSDWTLLETRSGIVVAEWNRKVQLKQGQLTIDALPAGKFLLTNHRTGSVMEIRSLEGAVQDGFILAATQSVELYDQAPPGVVTHEIRDGKVRVQIAGATAGTRVHLLATAFMEDPGLASRMRLSLFGQFQQSFAASPSFYVDSLKLDEEYQYILQRQYATKYPGNLLSQPSLLLNPWDTASTENANRTAQGGDMPPASPMPAPASDAAGVSDKNSGIGIADQPKPFYEFLSQGAKLLANRTVDAEGWIELPLEGLSGYQTLTGIVIDGAGISAINIPLPASEISTTDLRLARAFDPEKHLTQLQRVQFVEAGMPTDLGDARSTRVQVYASVRDVFRLYSTLLPSADLEKFRVLSTWNTLSEDEKKRVYSELACHELHWFLARKDPKFFKSVVVPYLENKSSKQFLDEYFLNADVTEYQQLWQRGRLNSLERVLLAQRMPATQSGMLKWIDDATASRPIAPDLRSQNFLVALAGSSLDLTRPEGVANLLGERLDRFSLGIDQSNGRDGITTWDTRAGAANGNKPGNPSDRAEITLGFALADPQLTENEVLMEFDAPSPMGGMGGAAMGRGTAAQGRLDAKRESRRMAKGIQRMFVALDSTREWAETQYYRTRIQNQSLNLIPPSPIWKELAHADSLDGFLSTEFHLSNHSLSEVLMVLALLDLPMEAPKVQLNVEAGRLVLSTSTRSMAFVESIQEATGPVAGESVMVGQDLYMVAPGSDVDPQKPVTGQALVHGVGYRASVVVTNPSSLPKTIAVLSQIPQGALPLEFGKFVSNRSIRLEPYTTQQFAYTFYFPKSGSFDHYGAQASIEGQYAASGPHAQLRVLDEPERQDRDTWGYVALWGTDEQVIEFLRSQNTQQLQLPLIAFRMADKKFFERCLDELELQGVYDPTLWAYAFRHQDTRRIAQVLTALGDATNRFGPYLESELSQIDSAHRYDYEHLDYRPLVHARNHLLGASRTILNDRLAVQYNRLLERIAYQPELRDGDRMAITYYMIVQNRIDEAIEHFDRIQVDALRTRLQYDYMDAFLDFYRGRYEHASEIAERYSDYGVTRWRDLFATMHLQVQQRTAMIDGRPIPITDQFATDVSDPIQRMLLDARGADQANLAADAPSLDLSVQDGRLTLVHQRVDSIDVRFYLMDIELLFSRNPFVQQDGGALMAIQPNRIETIALDLERGKRELNIPAELANRNVLIEVTSGGLSQTQVLYANSMDVTVVDSFGRLQVTAENGKPVEKAYIKVYARHGGGQIKFFKDGYTDLRGQFDYASLSTNDLETVERFAILILHPERGALIREVAPPKR